MTFRKALFGEIFLCVELTAYSCGGRVISQLVLFAGRRCTLLGVLGTQEVPANCTFAFWLLGADAFWNILLFGGHRLGSRWSIGPCPARNVI